MRDFLGPVNAAQVQTELGPIYVLPSGRMGIQVHAPHLMVDGVPLQLLPTSRAMVSPRGSIWFRPGNQMKDDSSPATMRYALGLSTDVTAIW